MYSQEGWSKKIKDSEVMGINHAMKNYWSIWDAGDYSLFCFLDSAAFRHLQNFFLVHFPKEDIEKVLHLFSCHNPNWQIHIQILFNLLEDH